MKKLHLLALAPFFVFTTQVAIADSTSDGDCLKDKAGATTTEGATTSASEMGAGKNIGKYAEPASLKGKSHKKPPVKGGVELE